MIPVGLLLKRRKHRNYRFNFRAARDRKCRIFPEPSPQTLLRTQRWTLLFYVRLLRNAAPPHAKRTTLLLHFQTPIQTTSIQPPQKASTTPWILTVCWGRPSTAWEGNLFSGTCCLSQRGTSDTSRWFLAPLMTRLPEVLHSVKEYIRISL